MKKNNTKESWDRRKYFHPVKSFLAKRLLDEVLNSLRETKAKTIVDLGCGEGYPDEFLLQHDNDLEIVGIDIDNKVLSVARQKNPEIIYINGNIYDLSFLKEKFQVALVLEVLEHLKDPPKAVEQIKKSAKIAIFSVPLEPLFSLACLISGSWVKSKGRHPDHVNFWNKNAFANFLSGFYREVKVKTVFPWLLAICQNPK